MATGKRYYWIKLKDSFFSSDTVDFFMGQEGGANYIVLYQMLQLMTANTEGRLQRRIGEIIIPYDVAKIKRDCKWFSEDTIRVAMELYKQFGLIYEDADGVLVLTDHEKMVGSETDYAQQKRIQRENEKLLNAAQSCEKLDKGSVDTVHDDVHSSVCKSVHIDIRDKILDKDINISCPISEKSNDKNTVQKKTRSKSTQKNTPTKEQELLFAEAYDAYPRHENRKNAWDAWLKITPVPDKGFVERIIAVIQNKLSTGMWEIERKKYIPLFSTFLNGRKWEDEITLPVTDDERGKAQDRKAEKLREYDEINRKTFEALGFDYGNG